VGISGTSAGQATVARPSISPTGRWPSTNRVPGARRASPRPGLPPRSAVLRPEMPSWWAAARSTWPSRLAPPRRRRPRDGRRPRRWSGRARPRDRPPRPPGTLAPRSV